MKLKIYVDRRSGSEPYPVKLRVNRNGQVFMITTGITCYTDIIGREFDRKEPNGKSKSAKINDWYNFAERLDMEHASISNKEFKERVLAEINGNEYGGSKLLTDYIMEFARLHDRLSTIIIYRGLKDKVNRFRPKTALEDVNFKWLTEFEQEEIRRGMSINGLAIKLRALRAVYNYCLDQEYTSNYPFRRYKIKQEQTRKRSLSPQDLVRLRDYPVAKWQEEYRDMFMLMFYLMGINAADLFTLPKLGADNMITYKRQKTGHLYEFTCPAEALEIIKKYPGKKYMLSCLDRYSSYQDYLHHMNDALKTIGIQYNGAIQKTGGEAIWPDLSSYWARHTWATIASENCEIDLSTVGECLGHSSGKVTSIYIRQDYRKIDRANRKVLDFVGKLKLEEEK